MSSPGSGLPEHEQQAWEAIVADLRGDQDFAASAPPEPAAARAPQPEALQQADADEVDDDPDHLDEGYVPPHPPPIPRPADAVGRFSWAAVIGGPILVVAVSALGWDRWLANLGVALTVGGFVSLVWRMKEREDDDDDGAVV